MKQNGFTIVETLIAVAVLLLVIAAPLTLAERSLASADSAEQEIVAVYLAQEAIEFVRNKRDSNVLAGASWLAGLESCTVSGAGDPGCGVDPTNPESARDVALCGSANDTCRLWQNDGTRTGDEAMKGLFGHPQNRQGGENGWRQTQYTRVVSLVPAASGAEAEVRVALSWSTGGFGSRVLSVSDNLMHWYAP